MLRDVWLGRPSRSHGRGGGRSKMRMRHRRQPERTPFVSPSSPSLNRGCLGKSSLVLPVVCRQPCAPMACMSVLSAHLIRTVSPDARVRSRAPRILAARAEILGLRSQDDATFAAGDASGLGGQSLSCPAIPVARLPFYSPISRAAPERWEDAPEAMSRPSRRHIAILPPTPSPHIMACTSRRSATLCRRRSQRSRMPSAAAVEAQLALAKRLGMFGPLRVRMAIHAGGGDAE